MSCIGFSTGTIWRWMVSKNRNELLDYLRPLDVSAVELASGSREELFALSLSEENIAWLRSLPFVSIHAPAFSHTAGNLLELEKQLDIIEKLSLLVNAKSVVIHPNDLPSEEIMKKYSFPVSIENLGPDNYVTIDEILMLLNTRPAIKFCIDISHATLVSADEAGRLVSLLGNRISHIHFSGAKDEKDHCSVIDASDEFYLSVDAVKSLNVPFIIEEDLESCNLNSLKKELSAVERLLVCKC